MEGLAAAQKRTLDVIKGIGMACMQHDCAEHYRNVGVTKSTKSTYVPSMFLRHEIAKIASANSGFLATIGVSQFYMAALLADPSTTKLVEDHFNDFVKGLKKHGVTTSIDHYGMCFVVEDVSDENNKRAWVTEMSLGNMYITQDLRENYHYTTSVDDAEKRYKDWDNVEFLRSSTSKSEVRSKHPKGVRSFYDGSDIMLKLNAIRGSDPLAVETLVDHIMSLGPKHSRDRDVDSNNAKSIDFGWSRKNRGWKDVHPLYGPEGNNDLRAAQIKENPNSKCTCSTNPNIPPGHHKCCRLSSMYRKTGEYKAGKWIGNLNGRMIIYIGRVLTAMDEKLREEYPEKVATHEERTKFVKQGFCAQFVNVIPTIGEQWECHFDNYWFPCDCSFEHATVFVSKIGNFVKRHQDIKNSNWETYNYVCVHSFLVMYKGEPHRVTIVATYRQPVDSMFEIHVKGCNPTSAKTGKKKFGEQEEA